jgi:hypothetical protein
MKQSSEESPVRAFHKLAADITERLSDVAPAELPKFDQPLPADRVYLGKFPLIHGPGLRQLAAARSEQSKRRVTQALRIAFPFIGRL